MERLAERASGRVYVDQTIMHCSEALFQDRDCGEIVHAGLVAGLTIVWHSAPEFARCFQRYATTDRMRENALQRYVVALFEEAYTRKAQDIHIIQTGDVTRVRLRILGELVERDLQDGAFGQAVMALLYNYFA
ncbi:MAG: hypothetical protein IJU76_00295 [Desulfovibrionaceae bacterium]|nr:hypothetical protein [Desulfovibrionaceae bacterium]